ncbi:hypothetical protein [Nonomuraea africana]|uniref:DUF4395 domain-containing protein n=2 Tax=Nonomuraea africana TaxID=46171 RepID=A0ABR9KAU3_9ACTN|nr:hypothetical protein [Nonomuraea africana]MBE1559132.1 hypothetical protein [Nonomuraea africana]
MTDERTFASSSLPRHLMRGAVGFGALIGSVLLIPVAGLGSLLLAPVGLLALRGCPACWAIGLIQTISMGRLRRSCVDGRCELTTADRPRAHQHEDGRHSESVGA